MPEIQNRFEFEPNSGARKAWLATRKKPGIFSLPGFYNTIDFEKDTAWVMLALCVEAVAVALTLYGGISKGGIYILGAVIVVILFVVFDIVGANLYHKNVGDNCEIRNRIIFETNEGVKQGLRNRLKKGFGNKIIGVILIVLSSIFKILAILLLGKFNIIFYAVMALLYIIVIYIHIAHTGYYLAERKTARMFREQHDNWSEDKMLVKEGSKEKGETRGAVRQPPPRSIFDTKIKLRLTNDIVKVGEHSIKLIDEKIDGNEKVYTYEIETNGILIDDDIVLLLGGLEDQVGRLVAIACLKHQVTMIH